MQDTDMTHAMAVAELRELSWNEGESANRNASPVGSR